MREMRPERDLPRPHGRGDQLRRDNEEMPPMLIADEIGARCKRGGALAGAERHHREGGIALVEKCCGPLLIGAQDARDEGRIHDDWPFSVALLFEYLAQTCSSDCSGKPSAHFGSVSISRRKI